MATHVVQMQNRRDTAANWTSSDPVLGAGEIGYETDTGWHKIGDSTTAWTSLPYYHGPPWIQAVDGGGPASTFVGGPADPYYGVMSTTP